MPCLTSKPNHSKNHGNPYCWWKKFWRNPANRLRSVVSPTTYFHPRWCRISSINSMSGQNTIIPNHCHKHHGLSKYNISLGGERMFCSVCKCHDWLPNHHNGMELQMVGIGLSSVGNPKIKIVGWFCVFHLSGPFLPLRDQRKKTRRVMEDLPIPSPLQPENRDQQNFSSIGSIMCSTLQTLASKVSWSKVMSSWKPPKSLTRWF